MTKQEAIAWVCGKYDISDEIIGALQDKPKECFTCKHLYTNAKEEPCKLCRWNYPDNWEEK